MPLDYLSEASDEVQRLFTRLDGVELTLRDRRQIPFTVLGNRLLLYPESGIRAVLDRNLRPAAE